MVLRWLFYTLYVLSFCLTSSAQRIRRAARYRESSRFWIGKNYKGTHSTSRGLGSLLGVVSGIPKAIYRFERIEQFVQSEEDSLGFKLIQYLNSLETKPRVLEIGCGEGRAMGQFLSSFPTWEAHCFNLKGYKSVKFGRPVGGAVSYDTEPELKNMFRHYGISLARETKMLKVHLGDASVSPWPYAENMFNLMLSQATLSKIVQLEIVIQEASKALAPGGLAILGLGGTMECSHRFWSAPLSERLLFCGDVRFGDHKIRAMIPIKAPFDDLESDAARKWIESNKRAYSGGMRTTILLEKLNHRDSLLTCPSTGALNIETVLKSCPRFTPAWDRGLQRVANLFNSLTEKRY
ncbi:hypothetical protein RI054_16g77270 [Pseudoscourfieldia marina]